MSEAAMRIRAMVSYSASGTRPVQEDVALAAREKGVFIVADGFGGAPSGCEAARIACDSVKGFLEKEAGDLEATLPFVLRSYFSLAGNVLFNALIHANRKVNAYNKGRNIHEKGGASVLAGYIDGTLLALANVGGCRAWMLRDGRIMPELVVPRTYGRLLDSSHPGGGNEGGVPMMALGIADDLEPEIFEYKLHRGDWLVLSTDGISTDALDRVIMVEHQKLTPEQSANQVVEKLKEINLCDNIAYLLAIF
ncbi:MAG: hypothetical protein A2583_00510 [Bdellovibrionales bacterium RIFOXYD1_FULL_53_11]|nr:MAG: hypothetical protein A2583_00510 [Bdellovibrionales bacterium RIFOXYD1_FULL_53_11]